MKTLISYSWIVMSAAKAGGVLLSGALILMSPLMAQKPRWTAGEIRGMEHFPGDRVARESLLSNGHVVMRSNLLAQGLDSNARPLHHMFELYVLPNPPLPRFVTADVILDAFFYLVQEHRRHVERVSALDLCSSAAAMRDGLGDNGFPGAVSRLWSVVRACGSRDSRRLGKEVELLVSALEAREGEDHEIWMEPVALESLLTIAAESARNDQWSEAARFTVLALRAAGVTRAQVLSSADNQSVEVRDALRVSLHHYCSDMERWSRWWHGESVSAANSLMPSLTPLMAYDLRGMVPRDYPSSGLSSHLALFCLNAPLSSERTSNLCESGPWRERREGVASSFDAEVEGVLSALHRADEWVAPAWMRGAAWRAKQVSTQLASWTMLRGRARHTEPSVVTLRYTPDVECVVTPNASVFRGVSMLCRRIVNESAEACRRDWVRLRTLREIRRLILGYKEGSSVRADNIIVLRARLAQCAKRAGVSWADVEDFGVGIPHPVTDQYVAGLKAAHVRLIDAFSVGESVSRLEDLARLCDDLSGLAGRDTDQLSDESRRMLGDVGVRVAGYRGYADLSMCHARDDRLSLCRSHSGDQSMWLHGASGPPDAMYVVVEVGGVPTLSVGAVMSFVELMSAKVLSPTSVWSGLESNRSVLKPSDRTLYGHLR